MNDYTYYTETADSPDRLDFPVHDDENPPPSVPAAPSFNTDLAALAARTLLHLIPPAGEDGEEHAADNPAHAAAMLGHVRAQQCQSDEEIRETLLTQMSVIDAIFHKVSNDAASCGISYERMVDFLGFAMEAQNQYMRNAATVARLGRASEKRTEGCKKYT